MMDTMFGNLSFDCTECLIGSPRVMSLFTLALTAGCNSQKPGIQASASSVQSLLIRFQPFIIALSHHLELVFRQNFAMTADDWIFLFMYSITFTIFSDQIQAEKLETSKV